MKNLLFISTLILFGMFTTAEKPKTVFDFKVKTIEGKEISLSEFKGKKLLIVNVASQCGYTPQYKDLEELYQTHKEKLVVLGFPANNFGGQEPGSNSEIKAFCQKNFSVSFPMFEKISVAGKDQHPLYAFLSSKDQNGSVGDSPKWNFSKYLVDENGKVIKFFPSNVKPLSKDITSLL